MFVTLEGIDGAGKSTVIRELSTRLGEDYSVKTTTEPQNGTWLGSIVREAIKNDSKNISEMSTFFLFLSEHADHVDNVIQPSLKNNDIVLCDRYIDSRYVYQRNSLDDIIEGDTLQWIRSVQEDGQWSVIPDLTIIIDISEKTALERVEGDEIFETEEKLRRNRESYLQIAENDDRYVVVDGEQSVESVVQECYEIIIDQYNLRDSE